MQTDKPLPNNLNVGELLADIQKWAYELGFDTIGVTNTDLGNYQTRLNYWLNDGMAGEMTFMSAHQEFRQDPTKLVPGTTSIICVTMNYLPKTKTTPEHILSQPNKAYIARYALGRDYHKLIRKRLQKLATRIEETIGPFGYRAFADSAPVAEKTLAEKAGLGWIGKHTVLLNRNSGSWFFIGELYTDLPLPQSTPVSKHCGSCTRCIDICPTHAITEPYRLDARLCIAYLTIELEGAIPVELRSSIGNRVFGCDDCQLVCPWNQYATTASEPAFKTRNKLDDSELLELFQWSEQEFLQRARGTVLYRLGYERWLRNIAVGLGNAPYNKEIITTLRTRINTVSPLVKEHIEWALKEQRSKQNASVTRETPLYKS